MYDLIIKNGVVIDGTGADGRRADVGVREGRIASMGDLSGREAAKVIDAAGRAVTPGFIDMHSHADQSILAYPKMESMLHQGITTFVGCQCGQSNAPIGRYWLGNQCDYDLLTDTIPKLYPDMYAEDYYALTRDIAPLIARERGYAPDWRTFGEWLDRIDSHGLSGNIVTLAGYSTVRMNVMGPDSRRPGPEEKEAIKAQLREALEAGAFGLSTGLDYEPGIFSDTEELLEMTRELRPFGGIYFTHWRKTGMRSGTPKRQKKIDGIIEALEIARANGIQVEISHLSTGFDVYPGQDDYMQEAAARRTLQVIDSYLAQGVNANFDVIPNTTGGTMIYPHLVTLLRPWYHYAGGLDRFLHNLRYADYRKQISDEIYGGRYYNLNPRVSPDWDEGVTVLACKNSAWVGRTVKEIARDMGKPSLEAVYQMILEDPQTKIFRASYSMTPGSVRTYLAHPNACVGNDTFVFDLQSPIRFDPQYPGRYPNPNTYCGFVKFLTALGMDRVEDSIRKVTGKPAEILGLSDRGLLREGYRADLLVVDLPHLATNENLIDPRVYPTGIDCAAVNGVLVLENGEHTGALPGGVIRRQNR